MLTRSSRVLFHALSVIARLLRKVVAYPKVAIRLLRSFLSRYPQSTHGKVTTTPKSAECCTDSLSQAEKGYGVSTPRSTSPPSGPPCAAASDATSASSIHQGDPTTSDQHPENQTGHTGLTQDTEYTLSETGQMFTMTNGWQLKPFTASDVMEQRYNRKNFAQIPSSSLEIEAGKTTFLDYNGSDWTGCVHPEGALYFFKKSNELGTVRTIFTNADVRDPRRGICGILGQAINHILAHSNKRGIPISAGSDLVLYPDTDKKIVGYYFADLEARCLVWAVKLTDMERITEKVKGIRSIGHIKHAMESQYWAHIEAFPHGRTLEANTYRELTNVVLHASAERLTSPASLSPYGADELEKISSILDSLREQVDKENAYAVCIVARFSHTFAVSRLHNFCGQPEARLDADKSVWSDDPNASHHIFSCLSVCMFFTPHSQLERLKTIWVDRTVNTARWKEYIATVYDEFTGLTLYSTVMLAVDVSFLAVPSVDTGLGNENTATVSTYVSIIAIVGSMTLSLLLSADARQRQSQSASSAAGILGTVSSLFGLEFLAVMYSLPFALLMWGMLLFLIGLCSRIFPHAATYTIGLCIVALVILAMAVSLPLFTWLCAKKAVVRG